MSRLRALLIGAGNIGARYSQDPQKEVYYPWASHAQILAAHPSFVLDAVVEPEPNALHFAKTRWSVRIAEPSLSALPRSYSPDVIVVATPPTALPDVLSECPAARGLMLEKPLGLSSAATLQTERLVAGRFEVIEVNLFRRADSQYRKFAGGDLRGLIGEPQAIFGLYGNGLMNNGTHMIDLVRMLFGELRSFGVLPSSRISSAGPFDGDLNVPFALHLRNGSTALFQPIDFRRYRENSLDIWGDYGRLAITQEGLTTTSFCRQPNRALTGTYEIATDSPTVVRSTIGQAMYDLYGNFARAIAREEDPFSPLSSAMETARIVNELVQAASGEKCKGLPTDA
jgi:predicted dehydrogenase